MLFLGHTVSEGLFLPGHLIVIMARHIVMYCVVRLWPRYQYLALLTSRFRFHTFFN